MTAVSLDGLHPTLMRPRVEALLADPDAQRLGVYVVSAFRSVDLQRKLWNAAVKKYGSARNARKWVAFPGTSNHGPKVDGYGIAVDLGLPNVDALDGQWPPIVERQVNDIAARHGLFSPMDWEDWHFEPIKNWTPTPQHHVPIEELLPMAIFKDDVDAGRWFVRDLYLTHLGREPGSFDELEQRRAQLAANGADWLLAQIADSDEARGRRDRMNQLLGIT